MAHCVAFFDQNWQMSRIRRFIHPSGLRNRKHEVTKFSKVRIITTGKRVGQNAA